VIVAIRASGSLGTPCYVKRLRSYNTKYLVVWCYGSGSVRCDAAAIIGKVWLVIERIYAPEESNIIPQCSAGPGRTRPDLLVLQVGCPWQGKPAGM
jgi:hypothetical protein